MSILVGCMDIGKNTGKMIASTLEIKDEKISKRELMAFLAESMNEFNEMFGPKKEKKKEIKTSSVKINRSKVKRESITTRADSNPKGISDSIIDIEYTENGETKTSTYLVGPEAKTESPLSSKIDEIIMACGYELITRYLKPGTKNDVYLCLTYPLSQKAKSNVDEYIDLIQKKGPIKVTKNGKVYEFTIKLILPKHEGSGLMVEKPKEFKDNDVLVIDIGGMNTSVIKYSNLSPKYDDIRGYERGNRKLREIVSNYYQEKFKGNVLDDDDKLDRIIRGKYRMPIKEDQAKIIKIEKDSKEDLFKDIMSSIDKDFDLNSVDKIFFIGGTTLNLLENINELKSLYGDIVEDVEDPQWIAINGLYKYTLVYFRNFFKDNFKNEYK